MQAAEEAAWFCQHCNIQYHAALVEESTKTLVAELMRRCWFEDQPWLRAHAITVRIRWTDPATVAIEAWDIPTTEPDRTAAASGYRLFRMTLLRVGNPLLQMGSFRQGGLDV
ncbi:hypothetical protein FG87_32850 [Nocardia vulneris]|uniref:Uncharacterized protein n=2 Tax=Nocardia vulneris TaxID=1141657 RepID=A0ABR4Z770_9NOCA|nr:hypothetical protein FG87_32850 [Nocardia vulneris]